MQPQTNAVPSDPRRRPRSSDSSDHVRVRSGCVRRVLIRLYSRTSNCKARDTNGYDEVMLTNNYFLKGMRGQAKRIGKKWHRQVVVISTDRINNVCSKLIFRLLRRGTLLHPVAESLRPFTRCPTVYRERAKTAMQDLHDIK